MGTSRRSKRSKPSGKVPAARRNPLNSDAGAVITTRRGTQVQESARLITPKTFVISRGKVRQGGGGKKTSRIGLEGRAKWCGLRMVKYDGKEEEGQKSDGASRIGAAV